MRSARDLAAPSPPAPTAPRQRSVLRGALLHGLLHPLVAVAAFGAYEHLKVQGQPAASLACLAVAAGFALAPVRWLAREVLALEGAVLHLVHGVGSLALLGLGLGGVVSGRPIVDRAALAPFAMMGAAQALMHADRPRSREQADALRRFVTSLPEVQQLARSRDALSPAQARRAVAVLTDLVGKAQAVGETELRSDPGFQSALRRAGARFGLSLGLDSVDRAADRLSADPAVASAIPDLRKRLAAARRMLAEDHPVETASDAIVAEPDRTPPPRRAARRGQH
jgi:hypothetical protein